MWRVRPPIDDRAMTRRALITALALAAGLAGCGGASPGGHRNKAGAAPERPQTLEIEATDAGSPEAREFAERIEKRSGGSLTVKLLTDYSSNSPGNEAELASDLRAGHADFGVLPARAWAAAGVKAFDALQAPFVIGDYDVARAAVAGPAGDALKTALENGGVVPLGLVPAELRRILSVRPLASPDAFRGLAIRVPKNATSAAVVRSLGAGAVQAITSDDVFDWLRDGRLDGAETAPLWAYDNDYSRYARYITGYALFDRVDTIVAARSAWKRLSPTQQAAVRDAARDTTGFAGSVDKRDAGDLAALCRAGVRVTTPTQEQLAGLVDATEPVRAALRTDPETGPVLQALARTTGAGPRLLAAPAECTKPISASAVSKLGPATIPSGTYKLQASVEDFKRWGQYGPRFAKPIVWTIKLGHGRFVVTERPTYANEDPQSGTFTVNGDVARFRMLQPVADQSPWTARWSYYDGKLTWVPLDISDTTSRVIWGVRPWTKVS
jgi:TRAP-type C4-dicarboxylate transport system substrate-binding protein